jgi:hypothetical protein
MPVQTAEARDFAARKDMTGTEQTAVFNIYKNDGLQLKEMKITYRRDEMTTRCPMHRQTTPGRIHHDRWGRL